MEYGVVEYEQIDRMLNSLDFEHIYIEGEENQKIINFDSIRAVINLEELGCPLLDQLCVEDRLWCIFHMNLNPKHYTFYSFHIKKIVN